MIPRVKPFAITWPLNPQQLADLDFMLVELYDDLARLDAEGTSSTSSGANGNVNFARIMTRVLHNI